MRWTEEDDELGYEWKDEDEEEIAGESSTLSRIRGIAVVVFLVLLLLGALYFVLRLMSVAEQIRG